MITGSSGFLGSHLQLAAQRVGYQTLGFCRRGGSGAIAGDIRCASQVAEALHLFCPHIVFHLASQTMASGPCTDFSTNSLGVENLLRVIAETPSVERVIWVSSQLVLRAGRNPRHDEDYDPDGPYGESKMVGEIFIRRADGAGKSWTIIRPTPIWGPGMPPHYARLLRLIRRGLYFHVGAQPIFKSFSYIENAVDQLMALAAADRGRIARKTLYLADAKPIEIHEWCNAFAREFGTRIPTLPTAMARVLAVVGDVASKAGVPDIPFNTKRLDNILTSYVFDVGELEEISGPGSVSIEEGVRRTARWFHNQAR